MTIVRNEPELIGVIGVHLIELCSQMVGDAFDQIGNTYEARAKQVGCCALFYAAAQVAFQNNITNEQFLRWCADCWRQIEAAEKPKPN